MTVVILAEKPSVATDISKVLGASQRKRGWFEGNNYQVTWAIGHLVGLGQPHEIRREWWSWDPDELPMLPEAFPLVAREGVAEQLGIVRQLFNARTTTEIVCATDAGREGELIFRLIYEAVGCRKPFRRLWISSLTRDSIEAGFRALKPGAAYDNLARAARARSEADWLVGMNFSRAYSLASGHSLNVGRVKTPTLAMVVARELGIIRFQPEAYREVQARFSTEKGDLTATYVRPDYDGKGKPCLNPRLPPRPDAGEPVLPADVDADVVNVRVRSAASNVRMVEEEDKVRPPPLLFDLTELQRTANRLWGWTAQYTLGIAQQLYEAHKVLSYPRTDSRCLSTAVAAELAGVIAVVLPRYAELVVDGTGVRPLPRRFVNDGAVTDHHAIIPTATAASGLAADSDAGRLYDVVCRRFLAAWQPDAIDAAARVEVWSEHGPGGVDRFEATGKAVVQLGWRVIDLGARGEPEKLEALPAGLRGGMPASCVEARVVNKQTRPPPYYTEATLLSAMEGAGGSLEAELAAAMRERGLGTPATRAAIIEELVTKSYMLRDGKALRPTPLGLELIRTVHPHVASPAMTGEWEARLRKVERGELDVQELLAGVREFVREVVGKALANGVAPRALRPRPAGAAQKPGVGAGGKRHKGSARKRAPAAPRQRRAP